MNKLYKSNKKWKKASEASKISSTYQRKTNFLKDMLTQLYLANRLKKMQLTNFSKLVDYLLENQKITKEEIKKFLTTKKQAMQELTLAKANNNQKREKIAGIWEVYDLEANSEIQKILIREKFNFRFLPNIKVFKKDLMKKWKIKHSNPEDKKEEAQNSDDILYPAGHNWEGFTPNQIKEAYKRFEEKDKK